MNLWPFRLLFPSPPREAGRSQGAEIMDLPYAARPHNVELREILPEKAAEIQVVDERSERIYDQIDAHVDQLRRVRAAIARKKNGKS